jgi:predicted ribonuclease YlaK
MEKRAEMQQGIPARFPLPRTRLIGRERERATARGKLLQDAVPLLTLTGPGGSGKTRLSPVCRSRSN